jgi:hypothetical protein
MSKSEIELEIENKSKLQPALHVNVRKPADYDGTSSENVITSDLNTHIILGGKVQNNPDIAKAAYNSTITLVSGMATAIKNNPPKLSEAGKLTLSPQYYYDSAVIQVCEQTNVDSNFGAKIRDPLATNCSAIALKADEVRLFSRGTVKIITGIDQRDTPLPPNKNNPPPSHPKRDYSGIHLIANNSAEVVDELHPLVLGRNLEEFLNKILNEITNIYSVIQQFSEKQTTINDVVKEHTHISDFTTAPLVRGSDPLLQMSMTINNSDIKQLISINNSTLRIPNVETLRKTYLSKNQNTYINSPYNKTN